MSIGITKFFGYVFPLKRNVSTTVHKPYLCVINNVPLSISSTDGRDTVDELRMSERRRVETSTIGFSPEFLTNFLIEDFDINLLYDELVSAFFIEEQQAMRSIDASL